MPKSKSSFVWKYFYEVTMKVGGHGSAVVKGRKSKLCPYIDKSKTATTTAMTKHLLHIHHIREQEDVVQEDCPADCPPGPPSRSSSTTSGGSTPANPFSVHSIERGTLAHFLSKNRSTNEWYTRLAVEDGLSFCRRWSFL